MDRFKFTLADIIGFITAIVFGVVCYFSCNFLPLGDTNIALTVAIAIALALWLLSFILRLLKERTSRRFKTGIIAEGLCLFLFAVVAFFSLIVFSHFFTVYLHKKDISSRMIENIDQAENMFAAYDEYANDRIESYEKDLNTAINGQNANLNGLTKMGFKTDTVSAGPYRAQMKRKMDMIRGTLFPAEYTSLKTSATDWLTRVKKDVELWNPVRLVNDVNMIDAEIIRWKEELKKYSSVSDKMEGEDVEAFEYAISFDDVTSLFETRSLPPVLGIVLAIVAFLCLLFSYFITRRHPRYPGLKSLFGRVDTVLVGGGNEL